MDDISSARATPPTHSPPATTAVRTVLAISFNMALLPRLWGAYSSPSVRGEDRASGAPLRGSGKKIDGRRRTEKWGGVSAGGNGPRLSAWAMPAQAFGLPGHPAFRCRAGGTAAGVGSGLRRVGRVL